MGHVAYTDKHVAHTTMWRHPLTSSWYAYNVNHSISVTRWSLSVACVTRWSLSVAWTNGFEKPDRMNKLAALCACTLQNRGLQTSLLHFKKQSAQSWTNYQSHMMHPWCISNEYFSVSLHGLAHFGSILRPDMGMLYAVRCRLLLWLWCRKLQCMPCRQAPDKCNGRHSSCILLRCESCVTRKCTLCF